MLFSLVFFFPCFKSILYNFRARIKIVVENLDFVLYFLLEIVGSQNTLCCYVERTGNMWPHL